MRGLTLIFLGIAFSVPLSCKKKQETNLQPDNYPVVEGSFLISGSGQDPYYFSFGPDTIQVSQSGKEIQFEGNVYKNYFTHSGWSFLNAGGFYSHYEPTHYDFGTAEFSLNRDTVRYYFDCSGGNTPCWLSFTGVRVQ